jgi:hypothetical protein
VLNKKDAQGIVKEIRAISQYVRFAGVIDSKGKVVATREGQDMSHYLA